MDEDMIEWNFGEHPLFAFAASLSLQEAEPVLLFSFLPKREGYYSVGYVRAPAFDIEQLDEVYQPMFWQEKRFPGISYLLLTFRCPILRPLSTGVVPASKWSQIWPSSRFSRYQLGTTTALEWPFAMQRD